VVEGVAARRGRRGQRGVARSLLELDLRNEAEQSGGGVDQEAVVLGVHSGLIEGVKFVGEAVHLVEGSCCRLRPPGRRTGRICFVAH